MVVIPGGITGFLMDLTSYIDHAERDAKEIEKLEELERTGEIQDPDEGEQEGDGSLSSFFSDE